MPIGLMADPLDLSVEKAYEPYSRYPAENRGVGTYWTTTADMKNMRYAFRSASSISPVWLDLRDFDFATLKQTKAISRLNLYGSKNWTGNARKHLQDVTAYQ
jgi:choloylglycine hydrolase